ncbi:ATP-dependent DNA helicase RecG [Caldisericum exile]|uniref:ATP-dependent DNA helicase RecG n=1 Tax=Caldisericum exile (strain DSM 21853 / NBRC 104410 / AZM16c01) TaxID=511051 RepID=A0A7U6GEG1_CALEA|nr:ATP-dependent DNA helicase RecG [Caldisericum exile]BAL80897.1 ATP-dependent DNA helicase RecG [Caldisericum exile AZM16c01]
MNVDKLKKLLYLEGRRGYKNDSVIGGFDRFVIDYINKVFEKGDEQLAYLFKDYGEKTPEERKVIIERALKILDDNEMAVIDEPSQTEIQKVKSLAGKNETRIKLSELFTPVQFVKGIGPELAKKLKKIGVETVYDFLYYFPKAYLDLRNIRKIFSLKNGETVLLKVKIISIQERKGKLNIFSVLGTDGTGYITATWFNQPYLKNIFKEGMEVFLFGKVQFAYGKWEMPSPEYEIPQDGKELVHTLRITPLYPLTEGLSQKILRNKTLNLIENVGKKIFDYLDEEIIKRRNLVSLDYAISNVHFPESFDALKKAKERIIFDELFGLQYILSKRKHVIEESDGYVFDVKEEYVSEFYKLLPFELTSDQKKVMGEILNDLKSSHPMNRLLHGDVGSGKTIVALFSMFISYKNGFQSAMMSPTEILAEQTYKTAESLFKGTPIRIALLTSSTKNSARKKILQGLINHDIDVIFGTHALIEEGVQFKKLGLVVVDEQHRFGVIQRSLLKDKAIIPHTLVMSATPIPRTLALTLYGDLDVSSIKELPKGRLPIITKVFYRNEDIAYKLVREELDKGHKAYVVCPLIEDSESLDAQSVETVFETLSQTHLKGYKIGKLHGGMSSIEKAEIMENFKNGDLQVLVSTTVVEVGVDVKDATVIVVEDADRFGLATLHQLRGRVGRSNLQSYCLLITRNPSKDAIERLNVLEKTNNGFEVAEYDLKLRGPGEILGKRQSGLPDFKLTTLIGETDMRILEMAREEAINLLKGKTKYDPEKLQEFHRLIQINYKEKIPFIEVA